MDPRARKDTLRRLALARRGRLDPDQRLEKAETIAGRALGLPELAGAQAVVAYVAMRSEVPTEPLLRALIESGRRLLVPYVAEDGAMRAAAVGSLDELAPGYRGIPEPRARLPVDPTSADAVIVPGVAFDERCGRLGYGGGFYDVFLAAANGPARIALAFETQIVDELPMLEHDQQMHVVVTEDRAIRCERGP